MCAMSWPSWRRHCCGDIGACGGGRRGSLDRAQPATAPAAIKREQQRTADLESQIIVESSVDSIVTSAARQKPGAPKLAQPRRVCRCCGPALICLLALHRWKRRPWPRPKTQDLRLKANARRPTGITPQQPLRPCKKLQPRGFFDELCRCRLLLLAGRPKDRPFQDLRATCPRLARARDRHQQDCDSGIRCI